MFLMGVILLINLIRRKILLIIMGRLSIERNRSLSSLFLFSFSSLFSLLSLLSSLSSFLFSLFSSFSWFLMGVILLINLIRRKILLIIMGRLSIEQNRSLSLLFLFSFSSLSLLSLFSLFSLFFLFFLFSLFFFLVFDGSNPPYKPNSKKNPLNYYGESKHRAEQVLFSLSLFSLSLHSLLSLFSLSLLSLFSFSSLSLLSLLSLSPFMLKKQKLGTLGNRA